MAETPLTSTKLNTFAPMTLPSESAPWPFCQRGDGRDQLRQRGAQCHEGESAITDSGTPSACAIRVPLSTRRLAPTAMSTAPTASRPSSLAKDAFSSGSSSSSGAGAFFIAITLQMIYAANMARRIRPTGGRSSRWCRPHRHRRPLPQRKKHRRAQALGVYLARLHRNGDGRNEDALQMIEPMALP